MSAQYVSYTERAALDGAAIWATVALILGGGVALTDHAIFAWTGVLAAICAAFHAVDAEIERTLALSLDERREALRLLALTPDAPARLNED